MLPSATHSSPIGNPPFAMTELKHRKQSRLKYRDVVTMVPVNQNYHLLLKWECNGVFRKDVPVFELDGKAVVRQDKKSEWC